MSLFNKTRAKLSIKTFKHPKLFIILTMILINIIMLLIAAVIAVLIQNEYSGFIDALFNGSVKWMLTPNAILDITDAPTLLLAVIVLIIGLVLFTGTIIALTTNALKDYFQSKESGKGRIYLDNHIVIINWNDKVPTLVADLLYEDDQKTTVMILSDTDKETAEKRIYDVLKQKSPNKKIRATLDVLIKPGDPLLTQDLESVSLNKARAIIIMNAHNHSHDTRLAQSDLNIIKIILSIAQLKLSTPPPIVTEVKDYQTIHKINTMRRVVTSLKPMTLIPVCFDQRLGQIIAQTVIERQIEDVYLSLFSFKDAEVYRLKDTTFETVLKTHTDALPLSRIKGDVFVLSENSTTIHHTSQDTVKKQSLSVHPLKPNPLDPVYIIGKNQKQPFIKTAFETYEALYKQSFDIHTSDYDTLPTVIETIKKEDVLANILLLSETTDDVNLYDADVIDALIYIEGKIPSHKTHIIVELLDPKNDSIIKNFNIENTIISNRIIALLLSKLALYPDTAPFYDHLLTIESSHDIDDNAITIKQAHTVLHKTPQTFNSTKSCIVSFYHAYEETQMLIGMIKKGTIQLFHKNLNHTPVTISSDDYLIFIECKEANHD